MLGLDRAIIMITGGAPGVGKSALSGWLSRLLQDRGLRVELFHEAEILDRAEFAELIAIWRRNGRPSRADILGAARRYLESYQARPVDVIVQDALFPFLPSLFAWGYPDQDIAGFLRELRTAARSFELVQVHLSGSATISISRAAQREGRDWLETITGRASAWADGAGVVDPSSLAAYFERNDRRARRLLEEAPWATVVIDANQAECLVRRDVENEMVSFLQAPGTAGVGSRPILSSPPEGDGRTPGT